MNSHTRLRNSRAANAAPCSPDDNGKSKPKPPPPSLDPTSPSKRRRGVGGGSIALTDHENTSPTGTVDAAQQGSSGYVPLVTSFFRCTTRAPSITTINP